MESQHMTQQLFATFTGLSPASLSSIFNGRTQPTLKTVEAIKRKFPNLSTDWLLSGEGPMYADTTPTPESAEPNFPQSTSEGMINFDAPQSQSVQPTVHEPKPQTVQIVDKPQRKITEIRIFYDDQTWESFVPKK